MYIKSISIKTHAYLDLIIAFLLMIVPTVSQPFGTAPTQVGILTGGLLLGYTLITDYSFNFKKWISLKIHLFLDRLLGIFLLASPWIFSFVYLLFILYVVCGIVLITMSLKTSQPVTVLEKVRRLLRKSGRFKTPLTTADY